MFLKRRKIVPEKHLEHPTTLKLFLYIKSKNPKEVGVREAQRALELKSSSTIAWHLEKLEEAEYVEKRANNKYVLTKEGLEKQDFKIPILIPAQTIRGLMIPRIVFLLSFLVTSVLVVLIVQFYSHLIANYVGLASLMVAIALVIREYLELRKQIRFYKFMSDNI